MLALKCKLLLHLLHSNFRELTMRVADIPSPRHILVDLITFICKERSNNIDRC